MLAVGLISWLYQRNCNYGWDGPQYTWRNFCSVGDMTKEEIQKHMLPGSHTNKDLVVPVSLTWPMGFAWGSYVAQEFWLDLCNSAGLSEHKVLSCETTTPMSFELVFAAATDDLMDFQWCRARCHTICRQQSRLVNFNGVVLSAILAKILMMRFLQPVLGCNWKRAHIWASPHRDALQWWFVLEKAFASPKQVHQILGVQQWFDLLCRCKLSVYNKVYSFVRRSPGHYGPSVLGLRLSGLLGSWPIPHHPSVPPQGPKWPHHAILGFLPTHHPLHRSHWALAVLPLALHHLLHKYVRAWFFFTFTSYRRGKYYRWKALCL